MAEFFKLAKSLLPYFDRKAFTKCIQLPYLNITRPIPAAIEY